MQEQRPLSDFITRIAGDPRIGITHIALFTAIYHLWVQRQCENPVRVFSHTLMPVAKISGRGTYNKTMRELSDYGYIRYRSSFKKSGSSVYLMIKETEK